MTTNKEKLIALSKAIVSNKNFYDSENSEEIQISWPMNFSRLFNQKCIIDANNNEVFPHHKGSRSIYKACSFEKITIARTSKEYYDDLRISFKDGYDLHLSLEIKPNYTVLSEHNYVPFSWKYFFMPSAKNMPATQKFRVVENTPTFEYVIIYDSIEETITLEEGEEIFLLRKKIADNFYSDDAEKTLDERVEKYVNNKLAEDSI